MHLYQLTKINVLANWLLKDEIQEHLTGIYTNWEDAGNQSNQHKEKRKREQIQDVHIIKKSTSTNQKIQDISQNKDSKKHKVLKTCYQKLFTFIRVSM